MAHVLVGQLEQITDRETFYELMRDVAFQDVRSRATAARNQMLRAWRSLPEPSPKARRWIGQSGPEHYAEHLPRLEEWVRQLSRP